MTTIRYRVPVVSINPSSSLALRAQQLTSGGTVNLLSGSPTIPLPGFTNQQMNWHGRFHYDASVRNEVILMAKEAGGGATYLMSRYRVASNDWVASNLGIGNGHIYGNVTMDYDTGDHFFHQYAEGYVWWWRASTQSWTQTAAITPSWQGTGLDGAPQNGLCWHPNLYGAGSGGLVLLTYRNLRAWKKSTNTWELINSHSDYSTNVNYGFGEYLPSVDLAVFLSRTSQPRRNVAPNGGSTPSFSVLSAPPFNACAGSSDPKGLIIRHPLAFNTKLLGLENPSNAGGPRVWETTDGVTWSLTGYTHPFTPAAGGEAIQACSMPSLQCCWQVTTDRSTLWRPPSA